MIRAERAGDMDLPAAGIQEHVAQGGARRPERDAFQPDTIRRLQRHLDMRGADQARIRQAVHGDGENRLRVAGPVGTGRFQLVDQLEGRAGSAERAVDLQ